MTPLISVLLPTRKRVSILRDSLKSLLDKATDTSRIELLIAHDEDDQESRDFFNSTSWVDFVESYGCGWHVTESVRHGYRDLHLYLNDLAARAQGKWIFFWTDDTLMETQGWDDHVKANEDYVGLLHIATSNAPIFCSVVPLFHRQWIDMFGCVSPINHADSWISDIAKDAGARKVIPVSIFHDRFENSGRNQDETWQDKKNSPDSNRDYWTKESGLKRIEWAKRLREYRESLE